MAGAPAESGFLCDAGARAESRLESASMRNVFDQYDQPENRLTHAMMSTLHRDRRLLKDFLQWLDVAPGGPMDQIHVGEQQVPGGEANSEKEEDEGLPDGCFFDDEGWAVLMEAKVQAKLSNVQLRRHRRLAERFGYPDAHLLVVSVDPQPKNLPPNTSFHEWRKVYAWFSRQAGRSEWARHFVEYMQIFEAKVLAKGYEIRGALTMFDGFRFSEDSPYTYREGKRLIRLLAQEFRQNEVLIKELGLDPVGDGRPALTRGKDGVVWDFIPLKAAGDGSFTSFPHATMVVRPDEAAVAITVPNNIMGGMKSRLKRWSKEDFYGVLKQVESNLRPVLSDVPGAKPMLYVLQRHYRSQRSLPDVDGRLEVDVRTLVDVPNAPLKHQPGWLDAIYGVLSGKRTNIQIGIEVHLPYSAQVMQTKCAEKVMAKAWIALKPFLGFGTDY